MTLTALAPKNLRLITIFDYHRMAETGILAADERVELLSGQIIKKMPKGPAHSALCKRIEKILERRLGEKILVRLQDPILLNDYSEPEPDIAVVYPKDDFYASHHPVPKEVHLIIEISDTTIQSDLTTKAKLYAAAGITDYWVVDVSTQQLHIFRHPSVDGYDCQMILKADQPISPLAFPDCCITVNECFGLTDDLRP